jgi:uncharacterized protein (DUF697 family)/tellurite resistance protein
MNEMQIAEKEAVASLRALMAVARADGTVSPDERAALEAALEALPAPGDLKRYLDETAPLEEILAEVKSPEAREQLWHSACSLANADGVASAEEKALLEQIRTRFEIDSGKASVTERVLAEARDTVLPSGIAPIADPKLRQKEIDQDTLKYSVLSAVLGAFPVPGVAIATDLAVVALQVKLVRDIGQYWNHKVDREAAKTLLAGLGLGTGARIAVSNLAKLVPGWGSAFGATTAFATTWALGKIANRYFESGQKADLGDLKKDMKAMEKAGKDAYAQNRETIEARRKASEAALVELNAQRKAGTLGQAEYERKVAELAG